MAVGKGSMARAAKAAVKAPAEAAAKTSAKTAKSTGKTVAAAETLSAPAEAVMQQIVYQTSNGMLERDAAPNEIFGLGDAMPVYYF